MIRCISIMVYDRDEEGLEIGIDEAIKRAKDGVRYSIEDNEHEDGERYGFTLITTAPSNAEKRYEEILAASISII